MSVVSRRAESRGAPVLAYIFLGTAAAVGSAYVLSRSTPESSLRRYVDAAEDVVRQLPTLTREVIAEAKARFAAAKVAFAEARAESERSLLAQLQEAKQRGSLPPSLPPP
jgi:hypothetical protein